jgi:hypothetical protein
MAFYIPCPTSPLFDRIMLPDVISCTQGWFLVFNFNLTPITIVSKYITAYDEFNSFLEEAHPAIVRAICSTNRPFFMSVFDRATNNKILEFERLMKCCSPILFPSSRATIIVRDRRAQILGFVKHA